MIDVSAGMRIGGEYIDPQELAKNPLKLSFKIIETDNFNADYPDEKLIAENIAREDMARAMCRTLNNNWSGEHAPRYYKVVSCEYVLQPGFEL